MTDTKSITEVICEVGVGQYTNTNMPTCFICFEDSSEGNFRQICPTCAGSTICPGCEQDALRSTDRYDVLSHCPLCRRKVADSVSEKITLTTVWHPITFIIWMLLGVDAGYWQQIMVLFMSHQYISSACRTVNNQRENGRPSLLLTRWKVSCMIIHAPYVILSLLNKVSLSTNTHLNLYLACHILIPVFIKVTSAGFLLFHTFIRGLFPIRLVEV
jgi:hypothetical protein